MRISGYESGLFLAHTSELIRSSRIQKIRLRENDLLDFTCRNKDQSFHLLFSYSEPYMGLVFPEIRIPPLSISPPSWLLTMRLNILNYHIDNIGFKSGNSILSLKISDYSFVWDGIGSFGSIGIYDHNSGTWLCYTHKRPPHYPFPESLDIQSLNIDILKSIPGKGGTLDVESKDIIYNSGISNEIVELLSESNDFSIERFRFPAPKTAIYYHTSPRLLPDGLNVSCPSKIMENNLKTIEEWTYSVIFHTERELLENLINKHLRSSLKKSEKLIEHIKKDISNLEKKKIRQKWADVLTMHLNELDSKARGYTKLKLADYGDPEQNEIEISLQPDKTLGEQIKILYKQAGRAVSGIEKAEERLRIAEENLMDYLSIKDNIRNAPAEKLREILNELSPKSAKSSLPQLKRKKIELPKGIRHIQLSSGENIFWGRDARANDRLLKEVSRGNDYWLHVRNGHGSHVIIQSDKKEVPRNILETAALIAAHYSNIKKQTLVDVAVTQCKYVKKPKGAKPGLVTITQDKTITVAPDPEKVSSIMGH